MYGFSIIMLIFSILIFIAGIYLYTGHKNEVLLWKVHDINKISKEEVKNIGKWTMISGILPLILSIIGFIFQW